MIDPFPNLPRGHYGVILADPPWHFEAWGVPVWNGEYRKDGTKIKSPPRITPYNTMSIDEIAALPINSLAAEHCALFLWVVWAQFPEVFKVIDAWGFKYKTCGFCWMKAHAKQVDMFDDEISAHLGMGYWTRANSEPCLLATRGNPKRLNADVRQGIIAPRREHSRKPEGVHERIERLVGGPYLELFARQRHPGWDCWGNEVDKFDRRDVAPDGKAWDEMWAKPFDFSCEPKPRCDKTGDLFGE